MVSFLLTCDVAVELNDNPLSVPRTGPTSLPFLRPLLLHPINTHLLSFVSFFCFHAIDSISLDIHMQIVTAGIVIDKMTRL